MFDILFVFCLVFVCIYVFRIVLRMKNANISFWFVCNLLQENCKSIFKKLVTYLRHQSQKVQIFAISFICNFCLEDEIGRKVSYGIRQRRPLHFCFNQLLYHRLVIFYTFSYTVSVIFLLIGKEYVVGKYFPVDLKLYSVRRRPVKC